MTRFKLTLCLASLLGLATFEGHTGQAWAQSKGNAETRESVTAPAIPGNVDEGDSSSGFKTPENPVESTPEIASPRMRRRVSRDGRGLSNHRTRIVTRTVQETISEPIPEEELEEAKEFKAAIKSLKDAKDDDARSKASATIQQLLEKQFRRDLEKREQELAPVEERVKALRQQLDKRKSAMNEIITLRVKTILNNADGLGFPDENGAFDASAAEFRELPEGVRQQYSDLYERPAQEVTAPARRLGERASRRKDKSTESKDKPAESDEEDTQSKPPKKAKS